MWLPDGQKKSGKSIFLEPFGNYAGAWGEHYFPEPEKSERGTPRETGKKKRTSRKKQKGVDVEHRGCRLKNFLTRGILHYQGGRPLTPNMAR